MSEQQPDKNTIHVVIDGPKDGSGKTPFTVFMWVDWTSSIQKPHWQAQCFRANLDEHMKLIPGKKEITHKRKAVWQ